MLLEPALITNTCMVGQLGQDQLRMSGASSPVRRVCSRQRSRSSSMCWRNAA